MSDSEKHNFLSVTISALLLASASMRYVAHFLSKNVVIFYDFHLEKLFTAVQKDNLHVFRNLNCPLYLVLPFYTQASGIYTWFFKIKCTCAFISGTFSKDFLSSPQYKLKCARTWEGEKVSHKTQIDSKPLMACTNVRSQFSYLFSHVLSPSTKRFQHVASI